MTKQDIINIINARIKDNETKDVAPVDVREALIAVLNYSDDGTPGGGDWLESVEDDKNPKLAGDLDTDGKRVKNLPNPQGSADPVRLADLRAALSGLFEEILPGSPAGSLEKGDTVIALQEGTYTNFKDGTNTPLELLSNDSFAIGRYDGSSWVFTKVSVPVGVDTNIANTDLTQTISRVYNLKKNDLIFRGEEEEGNKIEVTIGDRIFSAEVGQFEMGVDEQDYIGGAWMRGNNAFLLLDDGGIHFMGKYNIGEDGFYQGLTVTETGKIVLQQLKDSDGSKFLATNPAGQLILRDISEIGGGGSADVVILEGQTGNTKYTIPSGKLLEKIVVIPSSPLAGFKVGKTAGAEDIMPALPINDFDRYSLDIYSPDQNGTDVWFNGITSQTDIKIYLR